MNMIRNLRRFCTLFWMTIGNKNSPPKRASHCPGRQRTPRATDRWLNATLTNLYNARPTWLDLAHKRLDAAVFAVYGWQPDPSDEEILEKLLALNLESSR